MPKTYQPPVGAKNNAKKVLRWKKEHGDEVKGMTPTGWARARQLASGRRIDAKTVKRMASFNRHRRNAKIDPKYKSTPWKDNGYVAWLGWGGTTGINWALRTSESMKKENKMNTVVETAILLNEDGLPKSEIELLREGVLQDRGLEITSKMLKDMVKNYNNDVYGQGDDIPVNCSHYRETEAAGWIKALRIEDGSLWATIEWTILGQQKIKNKLFKFISIEFGPIAHHETGELYENVVIGAGLTNIPAMKVQKPITLSEMSRKIIKEYNMLKKFLSDLLGRDSVTAEDAKLAASLFNEADESVQDEVKEDLDAVQEKADAGESDDSKPEADEPKEEEQKLSEKAVANMLSAKDAQIKALQEKLNATTLAENVDSFLLSEGEAGMGLAPNEENKKMLSELLVTLNEDQVKAMKALFERVANVEAEAKGAEANKVVLNDGTDLAAKAAERAVQLMSEDSSLTVREANAKARKELSMA
jgi:hypothetical protein